MNRPQNEHDATHGHQSVDHDHPTSQGLMAEDAEIVPGTDIMGDETLVRTVDGVDVPGIAPGGASHTGGEAHAGPTQDLTSHPKPRRDPT